ncbi:hypothetical protein E2C01_003458 [Portunus trituberculatus]|uniref:Uncharacterized protein n=1 Tax=Portunus trituberculatus TaxID=210409 RepID=A0A5B7CNR5_PORTR|nr:hypothetical protein [Portunus trituberculatus]
MMMVMKETVLVLVVVAVVMPTPVYILPLHKEFKSVTFQACNISCVTFKTFDVSEVTVRKLIEKEGEDTPCQSTSKLYPHQHRPSSVGITNSLPKHYNV